MARALIVVDYQNDFNPPDGALAVPEGDTIAPRINELARSGDYDLVVATRDWHPPDHGSFTEQGGIWPVHCVQGTPGAELHPGLDRDALDVVVDKGTVVGLATDYCVKNTALEALQEGFTAIVDSTAVRGVDVQPGDAERALAEIRAAGASIA
jgi:nicotinamidase/pyrazinamidase